MYITYRTIHLFWRPLLVALVLTAGIPSHTSAHKLQQARIVHLIPHGDQIECYINLLLPKSPKVILWHRLFDQNKNRKLEPNERKKLGLYLRKYLTLQPTLIVNGKTQKWTFKEVQNSSYRGNPRQKKYNWDFRFTANKLPIKKGKNTIQIGFKLLFQTEQIPTAMVIQGTETLKRTKTSIPLKMGTKAICKIHAQQTTCTFMLIKKKR
ncbi:MAG TPA: hypothetical protein DCE42_28695 [Myxococcales bacterium]|nr:hypothetical protein [Deltaproteobacteria bacterium]MBK04302.1 hypothetical protein [Deltaproteobacteria bacterium]MBU52729.1 hypothetical protein [Deltaproteobacteria bacterium]HAA58775.1 hypothetical protein [Myxococcales bacterium]